MYSVMGDRVNVPGAIYEAATRRRPADTDGPATDASMADDDRSASTRHASTADDDRSASTRHASMADDDRSASTRHASMADDDRSASTRHASMADDDRSASTRHASMADDDRNAGQLNASVGGTSTPTFWQTSPKVWFAQAEAKFGVRNISADRTKYYNVVAALDETAANRMTYAILHPPADGKYEHLKAALLECYDIKISDDEATAKLESLDGLGERRLPNLLV